MLFRQFFEPDTCTFTYLLGCERTRHATLVDPVAGQVGRYLTELERLNLRLLFTLETHVHADHITGSGLLRDRLGSRSVLHRDAKVACADLLVSDNTLLEVGDLEILVRHTPGHTAGCSCFVLKDRVLTGDTLLIGGCGRTDFQEGDAGTLYDSIHRQLFTLPPDTLVYPGHDYNGNQASTIGREMMQNPRLGGGRTRDEFITIMNALDLPYPRYMDRALPANRNCGGEPPDHQGMRQITKSVSGSGE